MQTLRSGRAFTSGTLSQFAAYGFILGRTECVVYRADKSDFMEVRRAVGPCSGGGLQCCSQIESTRKSRPRLDEDGFNLADWLLGDATSVNRGSVCHRNQNAA